MHQIKRCKIKHSNSFENLSNEIIYDIFEYLNSHHVYESFFNLNQRFQNLLIRSNLPIRIHISSITKPTFHNYINDLIKPHLNRVESIQFSNSFAAGMSTDLLLIMNNFIQLKTLIIHDILSVDIDRLLDAISYLPHLTSLTIASVDEIKQSIEFYQKIFHLPALKYFETKIEITKFDEWLPFATDRFSSIETLILHNEIEFDEIDNLLSYVPKLRHLSLNKFKMSYRKRGQQRASTLIHLTSVCCRMNGIEFDDFKLLIHDYFTQISRLTFSNECFSNYFSQYLNADEWEQLISTTLPNLRIFNFEQQFRIWFAQIDQHIIDNYVKKFNSIFWSSRQWFFNCCYFSTSFGELAYLYSANPYRHIFIIYNETSNQINENMNSVKQLYIHSSEAMRTFPTCFSNVTQVTLSSRFNLKRNTFLNDFSHLISLRNLTELTLNCDRFHFEQILELLSYSPNIHTLNLNTLSLGRTKSTVIQQTDLFRLVSNTNMISHLTIRQLIRLKKVQLITALCCRLECLTVNVANDDLKPIIRYLLSKCEKKKRYLSSICFTKCSRFTEDIQRVISNEQLLDNYTLNSANGKVFLWW